jgi:hypothetical protein
MIRTSAIGNETTKKIEKIRGPNPALYGTWTYLYYSKYCAQGYPEHKDEEKYAMEHLVAKGIEYGEEDQAYSTESCAAYGTV